MVEAAPRAVSDAAQPCSAPQQLPIWPSSLLYPPPLTIFLLPSYARLSLGRSQLCPAFFSLALPTHSLNVPSSFLCPHYPCYITTTANFSRNPPGLLLLASRLLLSPSPRFFHPLPSSSPTPLPPSCLLSVWEECCTEPSRVLVSRSRQLIR